MSDFGYITTFDGQSLVDDTNTEGGYNNKAISLVGDTKEVIDRFKDLANGTRVNYDGTADPDVRPGVAKQRILCNSGLTAYINAVQDKKGLRGTVTKHVWGSSTDVTCTGVLMEVTILSNTLPAVNVGRLELNFKFETEWA